MQIYTDGSCEPNPGQGGWGYIRSDGKEEFGGELKTTNNRMEMTAILKALVELPSNQTVQIFSDSQYCVKGLTIWQPGWKKRNWMKKGKPMLNRDLWLDLMEQQKRLNVKFKWVKSHNGNIQNERADTLAYMGRVLFDNTAYHAPAITRQITIIDTGEIRHPLKGEYVFNDGNLCLCRKPER